MLLPGRQGTVEGWEGRMLTSLRFVSCQVDSRIAQSVDQPNSDMFFHFTGNSCARIQKF